MENSLMYFLKVNIIITILFLLFFIFTKNEKLFQLNRFLLLGIIILGFILPFTPSFNFNSTVNKTIYRPFSAKLFSLNKSYNLNNTYGIDNLSLPETRPLLAENISIKKVELPIAEIAGIIYTISCAILLVQLTIVTIRLVKHLKKQKSHIEDGIVFCTDNSSTPPFSFFNFLFINQHALSSSEAKNIIVHEKAHIFQYHSIDVLVVEILHRLLWINPVMILFKRYLKLNLEYIADKAVIKNGIDKKDYQLSILRVCTNKNLIPITNLYFSPKIKQRIKMMNSGNISKNWLKYTLFLPVIISFNLFFGSFKSPESENGLNTFKNKSKNLFTADLKPFEGYYSFEFNKGEVEHIKISVKKGKLLLQELFSGNEFIFNQKSILKFYNDEAAFPLEFRKNKDGKIFEALAFGLDVWKKADEFTLKPRKEVILKQEELKSVEGYYQTENNKEAIISLEQRGNNLVMSYTWNKTRVTIFPVSNVEFFCSNNLTERGYIFSKNESGEVIKVQAPDHTVWNKIDNYQPINPVNLYAQHLKKFEGKYIQKCKDGSFDTIIVELKGSALKFNDPQNAAAWGIIMDPLSESSFIESGNPLFKCEFENDEKGKVNKVVFIWPNKKEQLLKVE